MSVLNDRKIREYISENKIKVTPSPEDIQYQPSSLDLRLSNEVYKFLEDTEVIDSKHTKDYAYPTLFKELVLQSQEFVLCRTVEKVKLPNNILGRVEGRSSIGRLGVAIHVTAGFIDPGFEGTITLEIVNLNNVPVVLYPNQRVCQIVFEELCEPAEKPYGTEGRNKYQGQISVTPSRIYDDAE